MSAAFIVSAILLVAVLVLFIDERKTSSGLRDDIKQQRETIDKFLEKRDGKQADPQEELELTQESICDAVRYNGYVPDPLDGGVLFKIQGENYVIRTDRLPYTCIDKSYTIDPSHYDMPLLREAGREVTDTIFIGKILFSTDSTSLNFQVDAYEPAYKHFRDSLECYINIIHNMQERLHEVYEKKQKQKEEQKQLDAFGFRKDESAPNHKILS